MNPMIPIMATRLIYLGSGEGADSGELGRQFERLQIERNLNSDAVSVTGSLVFPAEHLFEVAELVNKVLSGPAFEPEILARIKTSARSTTSRRARQPEDVAWGIARSMILDNNPMGRLSSISSETLAFIDGATRDDMREFHERALARAGASIVVHSPFSAERVGLFLDELLDGLPDGAAVDFPGTATDFPSGNTVVLHDPNVERPYLVFAGMLPPISRGREFEDVISLLLFAQGGRSELYEALRPVLGASYEFNANALSLTKDLRILQIAGFLDTD